MATSWKSQQGQGIYSLQFETDDEKKYMLVEKAAQMAVDGKTADDEEVRHGEWVIDGNITECSNCHKEYFTARGMLQLKEFNYCPKCGAKMDKESD